MRQSERPVHYLVGTPRGRLTALEKAFLGKPWEQARESVEVKLLAHSDELYILAKSTGRLHKERAMRQRKLKRLWRRLHELQGQSASTTPSRRPLSAALQSPRTRTTWYASTWPDGCRRVACSA